MFKVYLTVLFLSLNATAISAGDGGILSGLLNIREYPVEFLKGGMAECVDGNSFRLGLGLVTMYCPYLAPIMPLLWVIDINDFVERVACYWTEDEPKVNEFNLIGWAALKLRSLIGLDRQLKPLDKPAAHVYDAGRTVFALGGLATGLYQLALLDAPAWFDGKTPAPSTPGTSSTSSTALVVAEPLTATISWSSPPLSGLPNSFEYLTTGVIPGSGAAASSLDSFNAGKQPVENVEIASTVYQQVEVKLNREATRSSSSTSSTAVGVIRRSTGANSCSSTRLSSLPNIPGSSVMVGLAYKRMQAGLRGRGNIGAHLGGRGSGSSQQVKVDLNPQASLQDFLLGSKYREAFDLIQRLGDTEARNVVNAPLTNGILHNGLTPIQVLILQAKGSDDEIRLCGLLLRHGAEADKPYPPGRWSDYTPLQALLVLAVNDPSRLRLKLVDSLVEGDANPFKPYPFRSRYPLTPFKLSVGRIMDHPIGAIMDQGTAPTFTL